MKPMGKALEELPLATGEVLQRLDFGRRATRC